RDRPGAHQPAHGGQGRPRQRRADAAPGRHAPAQGRRAAPRRPAVQALTRTRATMKTLIPILSLALAVPALGQSRVDERRPAAADGVVEIDSAVGAVKVIGWNREEVQVTGAL